MILLSDSKTLPFFFTLILLWHLHIFLLPFKQSFFILLICIPFCNLSPHLEWCLSNCSAHENPAEGLLKTQILLLKIHPQCF